MSRKDVYFQFPIAALRANESIDKVSKELARELHQTIVGYCLFDFGFKNWDKVSSAQKMAMDYKARQNANGDLSDPQTKVAYFACASLNVTYRGDGKKEWKQFNTIQSQTEGGTQIVRLRSDLFWQHQDFGWRDWTVLCAVYAAIGSHPFMKLTYDRINALALGYNSVKYMERGEFEKLKLTDRKMKTTTDKLIERGFFSKLSPNGRHNYWSWRPLVELQKMLLDDQMKRQARKQKTQAAANTAEFRNKLEQIKQLAKG